MQSQYLLLNLSPHFNFNYLEQTYISLLAFLIGGFLFSLTINKLLLRFSKSLGIRNKNNVTIRWSNESKPSLGGISMFFTFIATILIFAVLFNQESLFGNSKFLGLLAAASLAFLIGIADDAYNTQPLLKLLGQITCGVLLVFSGTAIDVFHQESLDAVFTVVWVVVLMNSLNMLDNMDGITGTVSLFVLIVCAGSYFIFKGLTLDYWIVILITQIGALLGFLRYNIHPAKMFMGDTGSQFIGLFVAYFAIDGLWNSAALLEIPAWSGVLVVLTAFTPAAVDTLTVVINRLKKGTSPMVGGKDHTTHHLVYKGSSDFKVWLIFLTISILASALTVFLLVAMKIGVYWLSLIGLLFFVVIFVLLYRNTIKYKQPNND